MSELFLSVLNMSIAASWIVLAVLLLRFALKKAPKWITVLLWAVVAIRLICPFAIESKVSLIPSAQTVSPGIMMDTAPQIYTGIPVVNNSINPIIGETFAPNPGDSINPLQVWIPVAAVAWGIGILALALYGIMSYLRVKKKISTAVLFRDNIYQSEAVASPFVLGMIRPKIYLPFAMTGSEMLHVIAHEEAHIRRKDHWWKPLGFAILTLHWFNPLLWLAYVLLCRDIEMACDEKVVKSLNTEERADYSQALLHCSVGRRMIASCPLAFGEVGVKDRVRSVLSYKKPAFWILAVGIVASIVLAVCFLTNPVPGKLGTLENLEFITLTDRTENTACVWVSDGFSYERRGAISEDLLRDLANLKTSKTEISLSRSEERDKSHTIILQSEKQAELSEKSYLEGLYIHFNSDFTSVWINNNVKPTLTYKVIEPQRAKEIYSLIASYKIVGSIAASPAYMESIEPLKEKYPMYFDLDATNGLDIYAMPVLDGSPEFIILPGRAEAYTWEEVSALFKEATTIEEMRAIAVHYVLTQGVAREDIRILYAPIGNIGTSNGRNYINKMLEEQFWEPLLIKPAPESYTGTMIAVDAPVIAVDPAYFDNLDALKEKFPMYFDLDTAKGLQVYIWQMAEGSYSCGLLPGQTGTYPMKEWLPLHKDPASLAEMRVIVAHYIITLGVAPENVKLCPVSMPHSSYSYVRDNAYEEALYDLFWLPISATTAAYPFYDYLSIIDEAIYDIDGDGIVEHCVLHNGPTSGLYTFTFSVFEDGTLEYFNVFQTQHTTLRFALAVMSSKREGQLLLKGEGLNSTCTVTPTIVDGNIVLQSENQEFLYWGEQGLDSPFASQRIAKPEDGYFDSGPLKTIQGNFRTYYQNTDGTYQYNGYIYKYRLVITGRMPNAVADTTYVYLSNMKDISFEQAMWASGLSSSLEAYFSPEEAVLVEIYTGEQEEATSPTG